MAQSAREIAQICPEVAKALVRQIEDTAADIKMLCTPTDVQSRSHSAATSTFIPLLAVLLGRLIRTIG